MKDIRENVRLVAVFQVPRPWGLTSCSLEATAFIYKLSNRRIAGLHGHSVNILRYGLKQRQQRQTASNNVKLRQTALNSVKRRQTA